MNKKPHRENQCLRLEAFMQEETGWVASGVEEQSSSSGRHQE